MPLSNVKQESVYMPKQKILVVDDDPSLVKLIGLVLELEGYEVLRGLGGAEGLRLATESKPDLVLLDIMMPDVGGDEVLEEIKKRGIPTRVIMFTGYFTLVRDVIRFIKAGACDYLIKPVEVEKLLNAIKRALALEGTINLVASDTTPIINALMVKAENLEEQKETLENQVQQLRIRNLLVNLAIRLAYLLAAVLVTVVFYQLHILNNTQSLFFLPIVIFVMLLFPVERIKTFSAKYRETETKVEVESSKE